jgi:hypothetical protein
MIKVSTTKRVKSDGSLMRCGQIEMMNTKSGQIRFFNHGRANPVTQKTVNNANSNNTLKCDQIIKHNLDTRDGKIR